MSYKYALSVVLAFQLAVSPAFAAENAPMRKFNAEDVQITQMIFRYIVGQASVVRTPAQFERVFLGHLRSTDRNDVMDRVRTLKTIPAMYMSGKSLVIDGGLSKLKITWTAGNQFTVNKAKWTFDPALPFKAQMEALDKALRANKTAALFFNQILPEAEADFGITAAIIGTGIGVIGGVVFADFIKEMYCRLPVNTTTCIEIREKKRNALLANAPALDALANQSGSDKKNVIAKFEGEDYNCPAVNDGKPGTYRGRIRQMQLKDGEAIPASKWNKVSANFGPDAVPTDMIISSDDEPGVVDATKPESAKKLMVHITFDPTTKKPLTYRIPNPSYTENSALTSPYLVLNQAMDLTPEQRDIINNANDAVAGLNYRLYSCVKDRVTAEQRAGIDPGSPALPKTEEVKTQDAKARAIK